MKSKHLRAVSFLLWWGTEAFGMIFTGIAPDFNSGLLLIIVALACWPQMPHVQGERPSWVHESVPAGRSA